MLSSGVHCQPTEVIREIEAFQSSCRPFRVETDAGEGFVKGVGNPSGRGALISELVAAELGSWLGLKIPPFAVVQRCNIDLQMIGWNGTIAPPLFFSLAMNGFPRDGSDYALKRLTDRDDISRLVVFDTWVRNSDRYHGGEENSDNLLYVRVGRKFDLVPIDHTHCFVEIDFEEAELAEPAIQDPSIFGCFPEFEPFITAASVRAAVRQLERLPRQFVEEVVDSVPRDWGLSGPARAALTEFICLRAEYVVENIEENLIKQPDIPGLGGM